MTTQFARYPDLEGRNVFITGGATGIGAEIVSAFADQGARVGFLDFDEAASRALVEATTGEVAAETCDLRDIAALKAGFARLKDRFGPASVLVNNAARDDRHDWKETSADYFDERIATNLRHQYFSMQTVAPDMIAAGTGSIINMGSCSWWQAMGGMPVYGAAKAAVHGLTRTMARELGQHRIRVNTVVPGWIMTERQKTLWAKPEALEAHRERQCLPDLIEPVYVARLVLFLASDDSAMCTAQNFFIDAGST